MPLKFIVQRKQPLGKSVVGSLHVLAISGIVVYCFVLVISKSNLKVDDEQTGHLYFKSDVYGFGVVLVEILTGLRAVDPSRPSGKQSLVDWIKPYLSDKKKLKHIMDTSLEGKYPSKAAIGIAELALKCLAQEPKNRPSMQEVLQTLEKFEGMDEKPKVSRRNSTGAAVRPHRHQRQNGIRSQENSLQAR